MGAVTGGGRIAIALFVIGCGSVGEKPDAAVGMDTKTIDAAVDGTPARCDRTKPFGAPVQVTDLNGATNEAYIWPTPDEKTAYFGSSRTGTLGSVDLWVTTRASTSDPWGTPTNLTSLNSGAVEYKGAVTADQLTIFFDSSRSADNTYDIYVATRSTVAADFGPPSLVTGINMTGVQDGGAWVSSDGLDMYFQSARGTTGYDLYHSSRANVTSTFGAPQALGELNTQDNESEPALTSDQLTIFFASNRTNTSNGEIYVAHRSTKTDGFGAPVLVSELTDPTSDWPNWVSDDECVFYFGSDRTGGLGSHDVWVARRPQ